MLLILYNISSCSLHLCLYHVHCTLLIQFVYTIIIFPCRYICFVIYLLDNKYIWSTITWFFYFVYCYFASINCTSEVNGIGFIEFCILWGGCVMVLFFVSTIKMVFVLHTLVIWSWCINYGRWMVICTPKVLKPEFGSGSGSTLTWFSRTCWNFLEYQHLEISNKAVKKTTNLKNYIHSIRLQILNPMWLESTYNQSRIQ